MKFNIIFFLCLLSSICQAENQILKTQNHYNLTIEELQTVIHNNLNAGNVILKNFGINSMDEIETKNFGINEGLLIDNILHNSAAEKAGLQSTFTDKFGRLHLGDIITNINGTQLKKIRNIKNFMSNLKIGSPLKMTIMRQKHKLKLVFKNINLA